MKKRLFTILAVLVMVVCLTSVTAFADDYFCTGCGGYSTNLTTTFTSDSHSIQCGVCNATLVENEPHVVNSWTYNNDATCGKSGTKSGQCEKCPASVTVNDPDHQATGQHTWENGECKVCHTVCTNHSGGTATCTAAAVCETCGQSYGDTDQSNHSGTAEWTKTATTHEKKWNCCNAVVVASEAHEWENGVCSECDYVCTHSDLQHVAAKAATAAEEGNTEYWHCTVCGKYFRDESGTTEIAQADTVIAKLTPATTDKPDKADKPVVNEKAKAPKTGDSGNAVLWLALLLVSGGAVTAATLVSRKKKYNR